MHTYLILDYTFLAFEYMMENDNIFWIIIFINGLEEELQSWAAPISIHP